VISIFLLFLQKKLNRDREKEKEKEKEKENELNDFPIILFIFRFLKS